MSKDTLADYDIIETCDIQHDITHTYDIIQNYIPDKVEDITLDFDKLSDSDNYNILNSNLDNILNSNIDINFNTAINNVFGPYVEPDNNPINEQPNKYNEYNEHNQDNQHTEQHNKIIRKQVSHDDICINIPYDTECYAEQEKKYILDNSDIDDSRENNMMYFICCFYCGLFIMYPMRMLMNALH
jgi:hypothetical protein